MEIKIGKNIGEREPKFVVGYAFIKEVQIGKAEKSLKREIMEIIKEVRNKYEGRSQMYLSLPIKSMRDLFKRNGIDPSKYSPSAEALLKRIIDGKDLYRINNVVECNNMGSMKYELPMGVYDLDELVGDVIFQLGSEGDFMDTMAKGKMDMRDILFTRDNDKLFGSPISDSPYAMITEDTKNVLLLVYGTRDMAENYLLESTRSTAEKIVQYSKGNLDKFGTITTTD